MSPSIPLGCTSFGGTPPAIAQSANGNSVMRTPRATPKETSRGIIAAWVHTVIHDRPDDRTTAGLEPRQQGHDTRAIQAGWLGHRSITSTAVYTALAPNRFKDFWQE
jgi:hypothetical protein